MKQFAKSVVPAFFLALPLCAQTPGSEIAKWQDGKDACVSITFDDSSINQFRIAVPLLNERRLPGTFFIVTGDIQGSKYQPAFAGRPIMDIIRESEEVPTTKENMFERTAMLNYLQTVQQVPELRGFSAQNLERPIARADLPALAAAIDPLLAKLRQSGVAYATGARKSAVGDRRYVLTWDEMRRHMAEGHEMANHSITHPFMPALDEANIAYELDKSKQEMLEQLGPKSTFSVEAPYGIDDPRVKDVVASRFPLTRNWVLDDFMDGFLRDDRHDPTQSKKEYVQWQRGPLSRTTLAEMKGWVDTSQAHGIWLVLVIHGIEGIGWESLTTETVRSYYDYIAEREGHLWIATFQDGAKYARERHNSAIATKASGDRIEVMVTHSLDKTLYDLPLTVKTPIPADWKLVRFQQGQDVRWLPVHHEGDAAYVMYRIAPNGQPATLEKAPN
jgi:peptidoglycan/xylan/chitin deacetylase (PgdA/CDA1 family)